MTISGNTVGSRSGSNDGRITAGYIRLTREESLRKGLSAPAQHADIEDYARRTGLADLHFYEETDAVGGDVPFARRKAARELLAAIAAGRIAHLVVRDVDRISRDVSLWLELVEACESAGVTIHTLTGPLRTKSPTDKFAAIVRAAAAQMEKEQVGDRVRRAKRQIAHQGRHVGGPPPFGYTSQARRCADLIRTGVPDEEARTRAETEYPLAGHLYVDQHEAQVVRLIFSLYVKQGRGCRQITNELNRLGYRRRSGALWHPDKVRRIIRDPVVAGFIPFDEAHYERQT